MGSDTAADGLLRLACSCKSASGSQLRHVGLFLHHLRGPLSLRCRDTQGISRYLWTHNFFFCPLYSMSHSYHLTNVYGSLKHSAPPHEADHHDDKGHDQKQVDQAATEWDNECSDQPQQEQDHDDGLEHESHPPCKVNAQFFTASNPGLKIDPETGMNHPFRDGLERLTSPWSSFIVGERPTDTERKCWEAAQREPQNRCQDDIALSEDSPTWRDKVSIDIESWHILPERFRIENQWESSAL
jgi:hypothetical protein